MDDIWKGEHLIRGVKPTTLQRQSITSSAASSLKARKSRAEADGPALTRGGLRGVISAACAEARSATKHPGKGK